MESPACSRASLEEMSSWTMGTRSPDKRGSFFKLIDTIASEIGELKQEMVPTDVSLDNGLEPTEAHSMVRHKDDGCSQEKDVKTCPRDSGYDSLSSRLSILDRLLHTHSIWLQLNLSEEEAAEVLQSQPPGIFLVRKSTKMQKKVLSLRLPCELGAPLKEFAIKESTYRRMYGADDFLPVLTYVIAQCDMLELDTEIEYMMELLDPSLLHGEGGYYLTSAYGALSLIKNFQEEQAARLLSSETRDTLRQWHKRRTTNRTIPSVDDFQNYLRVAFQEVNSGCTGKTLLVRPYVTTEDVCQLCAEKFKVGDPEEYRLFLFVDETWQQLAEDTYPQKIKAELHSRPQPHIFHFVYKRIKNDPYGVIFQNGEEDLPTS